MRLFLTGMASGALLLVGGLMVWQAVAVQPKPLPKGAPPPEMFAAAPLTLPTAGPDAPKYGPKPPNPIALAKPPRLSNEQKRFNRYDRDRNGEITRIEMLSTRTKAFRDLDKDGNNLLTFEEWAAATSQRFAGADANRNGLLTPAEFATTRPKRTAKPVCDCKDD